MVWLNQKIIVVLTLHTKVDKMARPGVVASFAFKKNHLRELKEVFEAADKNGDGKLSVEELYDQLKLAGLDVSM